MYRITHTVVTLKYQDVIGDIVGAVIESDDGHKEAVSLEELESMTKSRKVKDVILQPITFTNAQTGEKVSMGNMVSLPDGRPFIFNTETIWHKDLRAITPYIIISKDLVRSINESPYN